MIQIFFVALLVLLASLLLYAAFKPDTFRVERSATLRAAPETIFPLINDLHQWERWSPWEGADPALRRTYSGAASGPGAVYEWNGNNKVGQGRMEIVASSSPGRVLIKLDFIKPMEGHNMVEFTITQAGDVSTVTHAMYGPSPFLSRLMTIFFSMEKMVGSKFEEGLATLKAIAEK